MWDFMKTEENTTLFSNIAKNIKFEADENKQSNKEDGAVDAELDASLDNLKNKKDEGGPDGDNINQDNSDSSSDEPDSSGSTDDNSTGGTETPSEGAGTGPTEDSGAEGEVDGRETDKFGHSAIRPQTRPVKRKLGLYNEFNKLNTGVNDALIALSGINSDTTKVKGAIAQLTKIQDNLQHIMDQFTTFTEKELLIHYEILKERIKIASASIKQI